MHGHPNKGCEKPCNEVGSQSHSDPISGIRTRTLPILRVTPYPTVLLSQNCPKIMCTPKIPAKTWFLKSIDCKVIVGRGVLTPLWRPPYMAYPPPFSNVAQPPPPFPVASNPQPQCSFCLSCFFGWMGDCITFDVLFYLIILWIYTCRALVP